MSKTALKASPHSFNYTFFLEAMVIVSPRAAKSRRISSYSLRVFMVIVVVIEAVSSCLRLFACFLAYFALRYFFLQEFGCKRFC